MDVLKKGFGILIWLLVLVSPVFSQQYRGYRIDVRTEKNGTMNFYCINDRHITYTIRVDLTNYTSYSPSCSFPFVGEANPGSTFLFKLTPLMPSSRPSHKIITSLHLGKYVENPDTNFVYLLPIKSQKEIIAFKNDHMLYWLYNPTLDTVYAARSGTIGILNDATDNKPGYGPSSNNVLVEHSDGTIMNYMSLGDLFVKQGQRVLAGDPIALIGKTHREESTNPDHDYDYRVQLSLLYNSKKIPEVEVGPVKYTVTRNISILPIKFVTKEKGEVFITDKERVTPVFPEEIITKELSKSELKKRAKKRPIL